MTPQNDARLMIPGHAGDLPGIQHSLMSYSGYTAPLVVTSDEGLEYL